MANRIATTITKQIMIEYGIGFTYQAIRINKPPPPRVIVPTPQIVQPRLGWTLICTPEGLSPLRDCAFSGGYLLKQDAVNQQASPL